MESTWKRAQDQVRLELPAINALLKGSGIKATRADLIEEGLANTNYHIHAPSGENFLLRIAQRDSKTQDLEVAIAQWLADELPIPRVIFRNRETNVLVTEWMPGQTMQRLQAAGDSDRVLSAARDLGLALAQIASHHFPVAGLLGPDLEVVGPWPSCHDGLRGFLEFGLGRAGLPAETSTAIERRWECHEPEIREVSAIPCLSHGDFKPANLLIEKGRLSAVLDWEFAHSGTWLLDAGQIQRYLGVLREPFAVELKAGLVEGGLDVPQNWTELARTIDLASLVDFLGREGTGARQRQDVMNLIEATIIR